ncbi:cingulin [Sardina pilchardus]|uniref:cingulin n=1 Tax=Sardina pilchardus TaxID=27697 RepID=UPI002E10DBD3
MSGPAPGSKTPVDYGLQIRFINDLQDSGGGPGSSPAGVARRDAPSKPPSGGGGGGSRPSRYGVAVRVQGIAGQPYVVLKEGQKGDSYGVQLKTHSYNSLPRHRETPGQRSYPPADDGGHLRRAQSHGSLLDRDGDASDEFPDHLGRPPGDGRSGSYGNLDGGIGVGRERVRRGGGGGGGGLQRNQWGGSHGVGLNGSPGTGSEYGSSESFPESPPRAASAPHHQPPPSQPQYHQPPPSQPQYHQPPPGQPPPSQPQYHQPPPSQPPPSQPQYHQPPPSQPQYHQPPPSQPQYHQPPASQPEQQQPPPKHVPVNRLISQFNGGRSTGGAARGRSPDVDSGRPAAPPPYAAPSVVSNPYSSLPSSSQSSLGRGSGSVGKVTPVHNSTSPSPANEWQSQGRYVAVETVPANQAEAQVTPDLLLDQGQSSGSELSNEDDQILQMIYSVLRHGSTESDAVIKQKARVLWNKIRPLKGPQAVRADPTLKAELEESRDECLSLQEQLDRKKIELHQIHTELTQLRMDRESAEARVREQEDQLAGLQEELRREAENRAHTDTLQTELMALQADQVELQAARQKQDEALRQRERELTALKGALKDEVATHDREIEALREQYSQDMERFRLNMEQVSQSQAGIEAERQRVNSSVRSLQQQLEESREEGEHWRGQFQSSRDELRSTKQELLQARLEKDEFEEELKELQEKVDFMKQQMPDPKQADALKKELERCRADLKEAQAEVDKMRSERDKKLMEVVTLKKGHQEQEAELTYELERLREQTRRDKDELAKAHEKAKKLAEPSLVEALRVELKDAQSEAEQVRGRLAERDEELQTERERLLSAQTQLHTLRDQREEQEDAHTRLREKLTRLESQLQERECQSSEAEQELQQEVERLKAQLDEARRGSSKLGREREALTFRLEEGERERESLRKENGLLEDQKRQAEKTLDRLTKELDQASADGRKAVEAVQVQLEEQRERGRREQQEHQKLGRERLVELEKAQSALRSVQDELSRQKKEYIACSEEKDNALLDRELLTNRLRHLEVEVENQRGSQSDKAREMRSMEDKLKHLEMELEEEKNTVELMTDRINRSRDQIEQMRSELMQERSSKQDLELDKNALERQIKEFKSRMVEMEGQSRSSSGVSQLESKVVELEERLHSEEREKNTALSSQRRLERKLKDLNMALDEERQQSTDQRDQLSLRVKALKRQVDEGESELERVEGLRRKALRDMEEQQELKEALQSRVSALENELKRKTQQAMRPVLDSSALSSDDDDDYNDSLYDSSRIASILTESNLQTSSC